MQVVVSEEFTATLLAPDTVTGLGARAEVPVTRAIVAYWQAGVRDPDTGVWSVTLDGVVAVGDYLLVWRTGDPDPPDYEVFVPLTVVAAAAGVPADPSAWTPVLAEVAAVTPAYTRGGFDDDVPQAGAEQGTFTATTSPTAAHVEGLIDAAVDEVAGRVGVAVPAHLHGLAKRTAVWHVAAAISAGKLPAATDDATGEYRSHIANYRACLDELVSQSRVTGMRLS
ncbi:MAG TPA: hypothetical protein VGJ32_16530 [Solirubrobacteraceae bacterium]|jgi:hypothetical protein